MSLNKSSARSKFNVIFNNDPNRKKYPRNRRIAMCFIRRSYIYVASGNGDFRSKIKPKTRQAFQAMLEKHGVTKITGHKLDNCAEAHLWCELEERGMGKDRKHLDVFVTKRAKHQNVSKRDRPCNNCKQWVKKEFKDVNQVGG